MPKLNNDIPFRTYGYEPTDTSACGSRTVATYSLQIIDGKESIVKDGETDLWQSIQSYADSCDLESIVKRASLGDYSLLNQRSNAFFGDVRELPKTLLEAKEFSAKVDSFFDNLPLDIKKQYDNSPSKFAEALENPKAVESVFADYYAKNTKPTLINDKEIIENGQEQ